MGTHKVCQRDGKAIPSLDLHEQVYANGEKMPTHVVVAQVVAARDAAKEDAPADEGWCALARLTYSDYRDSIETRRINGYARRAA